MTGKTRFAESLARMGNPDPSVRLAGVYELADIADAQPEERQRCVDMLCARLRLPWESGPAEHLSWRVPSPVDGGERQVRSTIVDVVGQHLQVDAPVSWSDLHFDLGGATLPAAGWDGVQLRDASFSQTTFLGTASFRGATFVGSADFLSARFLGDARFEDSHFADAAEFLHAVFSGDVSFERTHFDGKASFGGTDYLGGDASFASAHFHSDASFWRATFPTDAWFAHTTFTAGASFERASFDIVTFLGAHFDGDEPDERVFTAKADFTGATCGDHSIGLDPPLPPPDPAAEFDPSI